MVYIKKMKEGRETEIVLGDAARKEGRDIVLLWEENTQV